MLAKDVLTEEWLADVLQDSLEMDWTTADGARAIMRALENGMVMLPQSSGQVAAIMTHTTTDAAEARALEVFKTEWSKTERHFADFGAHPWPIAIRAALAFATAEAASGAGEREGLREVLERAFRYIDNEAGIIAGVPNEPEQEAADILASDLADAAGVGFDPDWPAATAAALASLPPATDPAIPDGWKLVPVEPTDEMICAGREATSPKRPTNWEDSSAAATWQVAAAIRAALAAAPTIPATGEAGALAKMTALDEEIEAQHPGWMTGQAIPKGMKPWRGGGAPPDDWDGGPVLLRDGSLWSKHVTWDLERTNTRCVIAYPPKTTIPATGHAATEGEG